MIESFALRSIGPGTVLGGAYRLDDALHVRSSRAVFTATALGSNRPLVVAKVFGAEESKSLRRFYQEAQVVMQLSHPNIVRILDFGVDEPTGASYLVMERVEGRSLAERLHYEGPTSEATTARIGWQIAEALAEAHAQGVVHRDLKPANVMVTGTDFDAWAKVVDFGTALVLQSDRPRMTASGDTLGTPAYMSPEQIRSSTVDSRSDLYALGCVLYELMTGVSPFDRPSIFQIIEAQLEQPPPAFPELLHNGRPPTRRMKSLISRLLSKDPAARPASATQVARALAALETD